MFSEEMDAVNCKIAQAAVTGKLDKNQFIQGILVQCIHRLDREERGVSMRGRRKETSTAEMNLLEDAALSFSLAGGNKVLAQQLGQRAKPSSFLLESMRSRGLPNPGLALMHPEQLEQNFELVDHLFPRGPDAKVRRLMMAVDATYLLRQLAQCTVQGHAGLVGGCWSTINDEDAFIKVKEAGRKVEKAPQILEFAVWGPCSYRKETYSVCSMPLSLSAPKNGTETQTHAGNWEPCLFSSFMFILFQSLFINSYHHSALFNVL